MLYLVYAVLGVCCNWCMLYLVYAVLGLCGTSIILYSVYAVLDVCCTRCMLYLVYTVVGVNSWSWHREIERDDLTLCSCDDGRVVNEKERGRMRMGTMWRLYADLRNQGYEKPHWIWNTSYRGFYPPDRVSFLPHQELKIEFHLTFSEVPVSHDDFPSALISLFPILDSIIT